MPDVTIYDIAKEAGVSPATVSRVLTGNARVSNAKRGIVEGLIRKYDFRPNAVARGLSTTTKILGVMAADIRNSYYAALSVECEKAANARGYTVLLCNILSDNALEDAHLEKLYAQRVEAIIQMGCRVDDTVPDPAYVEHVNRVSRTIPFIVAGKMNGASCFSLRMDHAASMKMVMDHVISLGHKDIALIGGRKSVVSTYEKWEQYVSLLETYGIPFRETYVQEGDYSELGGYACMQRLFKGGRIPTAVVAINDENAVGVMGAALDHGLSLPGDLSIISFGNTFLSESMRPRLTSVDYNYSEYGKRLIDLAIQAAEGRDPPREQFILPKLVIRESCAPR